MLVTTDYLCIQPVNAVTFDSLNSVAGAAHWQGTRTARTESLAPKHLRMSNYADGASDGRPGAAQSQQLAMVEAEDADELLAKVLEFEKVADPSDKEQAQVSGPTRWRGRGGRLCTLR